MQSFVELACGLSNSAMTSSDRVNCACNNSRHITMQAIFEESVTRENESI